MPAVAYAIQLLNLIIPMIPTVSALFVTVQQQRNALEQMLAEKREPTADEWSALDKLRDDWHKQVQA